MQFVILRTVIVGSRLRELRKAKNLSQVQVAKRARVLPCYVSQVEANRLTPSLESLQRLTSAIEVPLYTLFYDGKKPAVPHRVTVAKPRPIFGARKNEDQYLSRFRRAFRRLESADQQFLVTVAKIMAARSKRYQQP